MEILPSFKPTLAEDFFPTAPPPFIRAAARFYGTLLLNLSTVLLHIKRKEKELALERISLLLKGIGEAKLEKLFRYLSYLKESIEKEDWDTALENYSEVIFEVSRRVEHDLPMGR